MKKQLSKLSFSIIGALIIFTQINFHSLSLMNNKLLVAPILIIFGGILGKRHYIDVKKGLFEVGFIGYKIKLKESPNGFRMTQIIQSALSSILILLGVRLLYI